jgi:DNA-directed RNA polymerase subunit beta'
MEEPIRRLLGLKAKDLRAVIGGDEISGIAGTRGLQQALQNLDIDEEIAKHTEKVKNLRGANRDNSVKALGYLAAAKKQGIHPSKWMISKVPVLPPIFRPIARLGDTPLIADMNELYQHLIDHNNNIRDLRKDLPDNALAEEKLTLYDAVTAAYGLGEPITTEGQSKRLKGAIRQIIGTNPKSGMFQSKVISKTVGGVGRGVVTPDPNLDMDSIGIPEDSAWKIYQDFVMRRLKRRGYPATRALEMIQKREPTAQAMLEAEMSSRPVLVNRAPVWHKFNLLAFYPHIAEGSTIRVSPLITKGFTMDFDGDQANFHVPVSDKAMQQAKDKMLPSKNLFSLTDLRSVRHSPSMEMTLGLYWLTRGMNKNKAPVRFASAKEAQQAYKEGKITLNDPIEIG